MRRHVVAAVLLIAGSLVALPPASAVEGGGARLAPSELPAGWYVWGAHAPAAGTAATGGFTFYGQEANAGKGPALAVGSMKCSDGFTSLSSSSPRAVKGLPGGRLARNGDFVWVTWLGDATDTVHVVAARGLDDDAVVKAARAARLGGDAAPSIAASALPRGVTQLVRDAGITPDDAYPAEQVVLVDATGEQRITVDAFAATPAERAFTKFWVDQAELRGTGSSPERAVTTTRDGRVVVARGQAPTSLLRTVAKSFAPVDDAGWTAFGNRVAELPVAAFFPQLAQANGAVLDGATGDTRWAVGWDRGSATPTAWNMVLTPDGTQGGGGGGVPDSGLPAVASSGSIIAHNGMLLAGIVPAAAASAQFQPAGRPAVDAVLGPLTPDGAHRYVAAWIPGLDGTAPLEVRDAAGTVIAQVPQFGCNTC
ncbi:MAG: hypothetical protein U0W40_18130 [Acidimicrobiia bacterium]